MIQQSWWNDLAHTGLSVSKERVEGYQGVWITFEQQNDTIHLSE